MTPPPHPAPRRTADLLAILALLGACFAVYGQTLGFGFTNFDDPGYVFDNANVRGGFSWAGFQWAWTTFQQSNWHPLTWLSLMADGQLYGGNAGGYHLTSLLLHAANSALAFVWLRRATGAFWPSLAVAWFFAVHPLHVESVAWISERKDVLSVFFCLLTLLAYTRYVRRPSRGQYALSLLLFALGLTAKPMLVTLPVLLLLLDYWPLRRAAANWRAVLLEKAPFFALAALSAAVTFKAQHAGHAVVPFGALTISARLASAATAGAAYVGSTFWPTNLGVYYPFWAQRPWQQPLLGAALLAAVTAAVCRYRRAAPYAAVGWGWFLVSLAPVIGVVQVGGQAMADRYTYLPHLGLFMAIAFGAAETWWRWQPVRPWLAGVTALAAVACLGLAARQTAYWVDGATLFSHTFKITRHTVNLCTMYGNACLSARRFDEAQEAFREGLRISPGNPDMLNKLGYTQILQERWAAAIPFLEEADRRRPDDPGTLCNLGSAYGRLGRREEALATYRRCLRAQPSSVAAQVGLADALLSLGQTAEAAETYEAALAAEPDNLSAMNHLAWLLALGAADQPANPDRALTLARRAVAITKGTDVDSLDSLAAALAATGHWPLAIQTAEAAVRAGECVGAPDPIIEIRRERLRLYTAGQWPRR